MKPQIYLITVHIIILITHVIGADDDAVLCTARFCSDYTDTTPCPSVVSQCQVQNSTYNGLALPSPDPCNCCSHCLVNLKEGDYCSTGDVSSSVPGTICGPGLTCDEATEVCVQMTDNTKCTQERFDYDTRRQQGTLGAFEVRPNCNDAGFYQPYRCIPGQNCYCVDRDGTRIYGETSFSSTASLTMKCECSRKYLDAVKFIGRDLHPNEHFRCVENGDYDTVQCIGNNCMCTDAADGALTFPTVASVNISDISSTVLKDCFKPGVHLEKKYYYECAEKYLEILEETRLYKDEDGFDAVFETVFPNCDLSGRYSPVQKDINQGIYYCALPDGAPIQDSNLNIYSAPLSEGVTMNCYCATATLLLPEGALEKPNCLANGNFNPVQCRRGKCYCVDENGHQTNGVEVDAAQAADLCCYDNTCESSQLFYDRYLLTRNLQ